MYSVLIADDEAIERQAIKKVLQQSCPDIGRIFEAANGVEALEMFYLYKPDIILCDIKMPGKNGLDVVREIRTDSKDQIVVLLTAFGYFDYAREAVSLGVREYLLKPAENSTITSLFSRIVQELDERAAEADETREMEKKITMLTDFFKNEYAAAVLDRGHDAEYLKDYQSIFPSDTQICITAAIKLAADTEKDSVSGTDFFVLKQRALVLLKNELEKQRYSFFFHDRSGYLFLLLYPDCGMNLGEDFSIIASHLKEAKDLIFKRTGLSICGYFHLVHNNPAAAHLGLEYARINLEKHLSGKGLDNGSDISISADSDIYAYCDASGKTECGGSFNESARVISPRLSRLMVEVGKKIDAEFKQVITLDEAAAAVNLSSYYFSKVFKQYWGRNFVDYLNEVRFNHACMLLRDPHLSIKEVAVESGYSDSNYFSRVFKTMSGETPSEYRNKNMI